MMTNRDCEWRIVCTAFYIGNHKLEDLKVLRRSPDLFNYVEIGQGQLQLIIKHILFYHIWGLQPFWSSDLKQSNEYSIKQPSDRYVAVQMSGTG